MDEKKVELRRVLSKLGYCSRKDAEYLIQDARVSVNGKYTTDFLFPAHLSDDIRVDGKRVVEKKLEIYAFHKPRGVITTMDQFEKRPKIADYMPTHKYLFPVGRLDKASRGLLIITNDNDFGDYILSPETKLTKTYRVQIKGKFIEDHLGTMMRGVFIDNQRYTVKNAKVWRKNPGSAWLEIELIEGKNRQIRKMLETLGYEVLELIRIRIGNLKLGNLQPGEMKKIVKGDVI